MDEGGDSGNAERQGQPPPSRETAGDGAQQIGPGADFPGAEIEAMDLLLQGFSSQFRSQSQQVRIAHREDE